MLGNPSRLLHRKADHRYPQAARYVSPPDAIWPRRLIFERLRSAGTIPVVPAVERRWADAQYLQGSSGRQMRLLDQADDLELLGAGESHASSPPSALMLFLSKRSSSACAATTSFRSWAWRLRSFTSSLVAARAVSPARRRLPASRNSLDQL